MDMAHYMATDAIDPIVDEVLGKSGLCDQGNAKKYNNNNNKTSYWTFIVRLDFHFRFSVNGELLFESKLFCILFTQPNSCWREREQTSS